MLENAVRITIAACSSETEMSRLHRISRETGSSFVRAPILRDAARLRALVRTRVRAVVPARVRAPVRLLVDRMLLRKTSSSLLPAADAQRPQASDSIVFCVSFITRHRRFHEQCG